MSNELRVSDTTTSNPGASKAAISFHYDLGNEFFRLFLDRECCYSCAMYDGESDTFEDAQQRKLEYHIQQARADSAARVLDIGCGWGALQKRLVKEHGVKLAVGLTLSENQAEWIRTMVSPGSRFASRAGPITCRRRRTTRSFRSGRLSILRARRAARCACADIAIFSSDVTGG